MSVTQMLAAGRRAAEALMTDTCQIWRPDPKATPLPDGTQPSTLVYEGKCKVNSFRAYESNLKSGNHVYTITRQELHVPVTAGQFKVDDTVKIITSATSPNLPGTQFRVSRPDDKTHQTAQRLGIEEPAA